jgi:uncharacterized membrane protein AbrB (regulator of aidB expression)
MASARSARGGVGEGPDYAVEEAGERISGLHDETKWSVLTTEFWAMVAVIAAILITTAVDDALDAPRGWLLVTIVATGYIVSRGIAKAGVGHLPVGALRARRR